jgi:hypothetical protein
VKKEEVSVCEFCSSTRTINNRISNEALVVVCAAFVARLC